MTTQYQILKVLSTSGPMSRNKIWELVGESYRDFQGFSLTITEAELIKLDEETFTKVWCALEKVLQKIFDAYRPRKHEPEALSTIFHRICDKAGVEHESGWGWHSIRRSLVTCLTGLLPKNNLDPAMLADYMGWAKSSLGGLYGGASMVGFYRRPEILDSDPYGLDKLIYTIHPFLPLWQDEKLTKRFTRKTSTSQS